MIKSLEQLKKKGKLENLQLQQLINLQTYQEKIDKDNRTFYGSYSDKDLTNIVCLTSKVAFDGLKEEKPRNLVLASATLPELQDCKEAFGDTFSKYLNYHLENPEMLYLTVLDKVKPFKSINPKKKKLLRFLDFRADEVENL